LTRSFYLAWLLLHYFKEQNFLFTFGASKIRLSSLSTKKIEIIFPASSTSFLPFHPKPEDYLF